MNYAVTNSSTPIVEGLFPQQMRRACFISDRSFATFPIDGAQRRRRRSNRAPNCVLWKIAILASRIARNGQVSLQERLVVML